MEIEKLKGLLKEANIPFRERVLMDTPQLYYPDMEYPTWDVICHVGSWGYEQGLLEIRIDQNEPTGYLTAEETFKLIKETIKGETNGKRRR